MKLLSSHSKYFVVLDDAQCFFYLGETPQVQRGTPQVLSPSGNQGRQICSLTSEQLDLEHVTKAWAIRPAPETGHLRLKVDWMSIVKVELRLVTQLMAEIGRIPPPKFLVT